MKEIVQPKIDTFTPKPYNVRGDRFMAEHGDVNMGQPRNPTNPNPRNPERLDDLPYNVGSATRRLEQAKRQGEQRPPQETRQEAARRMLERTDLHVDVRRVLEDVVREGVPPVSNAGQATDSDEELRPGPIPTAGAGGAGAGAGGRQQPPVDSGSASQDQNGSSGDSNAGNGEEDGGITQADYIIASAIEDPKLFSIIKKINDKLEETKSHSRMELDDKFIALSLGELLKLTQKKLNPSDARILKENLDLLNEWRIEKLPELEQAAKSREYGRIAREIIRVFSLDNVREELVKPKPNLNGLTELKDLVDKVVDPTKSDIIFLADTISSDKGRIHIRGKEDIVIPEENQRLLFEWLAEKIISIPDSNPIAHYNIGSFYITANLDSLLDMARRRLDPKSSSYLSELKHYRQTMHELNVSLRVADEYKQYVLKELSSEGFDFINNDLAGVSSILRIYEKVYPNTVSVKRKWLMGEDIASIEKEVKEIVDDQFKHGELKKEDRILTEWEKDRAFRMARILFSGSQRKAVYSGFGDIPADVAARIGSMPEEYIARSLYDWKTVSPRFFSGDKGPRRFMEHVFKYTRKLNKGQFDHGVLGVDADTMIQNSFGYFDLQSHGWRMALEFWGNQLFTKADGTSVTLAQIMNSTLTRYTGGNYDMEKWGMQLDSKDDTKRVNFSNELRSTILGQRVYLSSLVRYGDFSNDLKADIWRKRASWMPSTAVTLLSDEMLVNNTEKGDWEKLRHKLYRAEERRIMDEKLESRSLEDVKAEADRFEKGKKAATPADRELRYEFVNEYCKSEEFSDTERQFIKSLIDRVYDGIKVKNDKGEHHHKIAESLAETNTTFTLIIDDAPVIAWKKKGGDFGSAGLETADFIRLLGPDHENVGKGWAPLSALSESPQTGNVEIFAQAVQPIADVIGRDGATRKVEPFIAAMMEMYTTDTSNEWVPGMSLTNRVIGRPTSEIEELYKKTFISWGPVEKRDFIIALLQMRSLTDEGYDRMRKETKSTEVWVALAMFRFWAQLIGWSAAFNMFKELLPEEIDKDLKFEF